MRHNYYERCERCNGLVGNAGHTIKASGRLLCSRCIRTLRYDRAGHRVDDMVVPATLELVHKIKEAYGLQGDVSRRGKEADAPAES